MTRVAVVIGNHNGERYLPECIGSLREQQLQPSEIVVVDGASSDNSLTVAARLGARAIQRPNLGLGHLYNVGVSATTAEFIFLANNDIAAEPECLHQLAEALAGDSSAFCTDARQLDWQGNRTIHARTTLRKGRMTREYLPGLHLDPNVHAGTVTPTVCANGAAMLVRRSMYVQLGGFDETFFMEWEDLDLCWRAWMRGWRSLYVPSAVVRHRVGAVTTGAVRPRRSASSQHNLVRFALKCLPARSAAQVTVGVIMRIPAHPRAVSTGLGGVARELPGILRQRREAKPTTALTSALLEDQA